MVVEKRNIMDDGDKKYGNVDSRTQRTTTPFSAQEKQLEETI